MPSKRSEITSLILLIGAAFFVTSGGLAGQLRDDAVRNDLLGNWSGKAPDGTAVTLEFRDDGGASFVVDGSPTEQRFRIDSTTQPMQLDLYEPFVLNGEIVDTLYLMKAIFLLERDSLTLAARLGNTATRPTSIDEGQVIKLTRRR